MFSLLLKLKKKVKEAKEGEEEEREKKQKHSRKTSVRLTFTYAIIKCNLFVFRAGEFNPNLKNERQKKRT